MAIKYNSYKVEFALRGAAHIHGVLWMDWKNLQGFDSKDIEAIEAVEGKNPFVPGNGSEEKSTQNHKKLLKGRLTKK